MLAGLNPKCVASQPLFLETTVELRPNDSQLVPIFSTRSTCLVHFCYLLTLMSSRSTPFSSLKRAGDGGGAAGGGGRSRKKSCRQEEADAEKDAADAAKTQKSNADKAAHAEKTKAAGKAASDAAKESAAAGFARSAAQAASSERRHGQEQSCHHRRLV